MANIYDIKGLLHKLYDLLDEIDNSENPDLDNMK